MYNWTWIIVRVPDFTLITCCAWTSYALRSSEGLGAGDFFEMQLLL